MSCHVMFCYVMSCHVMSCHVMLCIYIYIHICVACVWICIYIYVDEYVTQCKTVCTFVCWCASIRTHMHIFRLAFERLFLPICRPSPFQVTRLGCAGLESSVQNCRTWPTEWRCQLWAILHPPVVREHGLEHFCLPILILTWFSK
jgi:hypothetical protein